MSLPRPVASSGSFDGPRKIRASTRMTVISPIAEVEHDRKFNTSHRRRATKPTDADGSGGEEIDLAGRPQRVGVDPAPAQALGQLVAGRVDQRHLGGARRLDVADQLGEVGRGREGQARARSAARAAACGLAPRRPRPGSAPARRAPARRGGRPRAAPARAAPRPRRACPRTAAAAAPAARRRRVAPSPPARSPGARRGRRGRRPSAAATSTATRERLDRARRGAPPRASASRTGGAPPRRAPARAGKTRRRGWRSVASMHSASAARTPPAGVADRSARRRRCAGPPRSHSSDAAPGMKPDGNISRRSSPRRTGGRSPRAARAPAAARRPGRAAPASPRSSASGGARRPRRGSARRARAPSDRRVRQEDQIAARGRVARDHRARRAGRRRAMNERARVCFAGVHVGRTMSTRHYMLLEGRTGPVSSRSSDGRRQPPVPAGSGSVGPTEADGVACVDVRDPKTGTNFRFYDFEYQLALQLNGQPLRERDRLGVGDLRRRSDRRGHQRVRGRLSGAGVPGARASEAAARPSRGSGAAAADADPRRKTVRRRRPRQRRGGVDVGRRGEDRDVRPRPRRCSTSRAELTPVAPALPSLDDEPSSRPPDGAPGRRDAAARQWRARPSAPRRCACSTSCRARRRTRPRRRTTSRRRRAAGGPRDPAARSGGDLRPRSRRRAGRRISTARCNRPTSDAAARGARAAGGHRPRRRRPCRGLAGRRSSAAARAAPAPPGLSERRQPPAPEAVVMAAFTDEPRGGQGEAARRDASSIVVILLLAIARHRLRAWSPRARAPCRRRCACGCCRPQAGGGLSLVLGPRHRHRPRGAHAGVRQRRACSPSCCRAGTEFAAGDILGRLRGASADRGAARADSGRGSRSISRCATACAPPNNQPELRQAEIKLAEKQRLIDEAHGEPRQAGRARARAGRGGRDARQGRHAGRAGAPLAAREGADACTASSSWTPRRRRERGQARLLPRRGGRPRAARVERGRRRAASGTAADVGSPDAQAGAALRRLHRRRSHGARAPSKVRVTLPDDLGLVPGQPLRLARQRYDAVFPVPAAAVQRRRRATVGLDRGRGDGTAERRDVAVADVERRRAGQRRPARRRRGDRRSAGGPAAHGAPIVVER